MRWTLGVILALALLALPAQAGERSESKTETIRLVSTLADWRLLVDRTPKGQPSKGDVEWGRSVLRNAVPQFGRSKGAIVGSDVGTYTTISVNPYRATQRFTVKLPGGTLRVLGVATAASADAHVVGGTGDFDGARGVSDVRDLEPDGDPALNIYRLRLP